MAIQAVREKQISRKLTNDQICRAIACRDIKGYEAAEMEFGVDRKYLDAIAPKMRKRPDLHSQYWDYRRSLAKNWVGAISEGTITCVSVLSREIQKPDPNLHLVRELTAALRVLGEINVSISAVAPEEVEDVPLYQSIEPGVEAKDAIVDVHAG